MNTKPSSSPLTKQKLLEQADACRQAIWQNQGALNLCIHFLKNGLYAEAQEESSKEEK